MYDMELHKSSCHKSHDKNVLEKIHSSNNLSFSCATCEKSFTTEGKLNLHKRWHTSERPYLCEVCKRSFILKETFTAHYKQLHGTDEDRPFLCSGCGKRFVSKAECLRHEERHGSARSYKCPKCTKCFKTNRDLQGHLNNAFHNNKRKEPCELCGKCFPSKKLLRSHLQTHTGERPYKCIKCNLSFRYPYILKRHNLRKHTSTNIKMSHKTKNHGKNPEKTVACIFCDRKLQVRKYIEHVNRHNKERPFHCNICGKEFCSSLEMDKHKALHL